MPPLTDRVARFASEHHMFAPGQRVGVAVSGGSDSVCLLHILAELASRWELTLALLHLDHQMRGAEAIRDRDYVRDLADRFGFSFFGESTDVPRLARETADNLEQAARRARREFFLRSMRERALDRVALGHTRNDQAETVLFRFLRGAGTAGLAGMRPVTPEGFVRPLLATERGEILDYLGERRIEWCEDSTNADPAFARNRIRHLLLPELSREWNPQLIGTLAHMAAVAADEEDYWAHELELLTGEAFLRKPPALYFRAGWLASLDPAAARRAVRRAICEVRGDLRGIGFEHVEQVLALARHTEGSGRLQAPGVDVFRSFDWFRLIPPGHDTLEARDYHIDARCPGRYRIPETDWTVELEFEPGNGQEQAKRARSGYNERESDLDWDRLTGALELRNWRPGDQYRPVGHSSRAKLKFLFQDARIPLWQRRKWPVLAMGDAILWAAQFGAAADYAATPRSRTILRVRNLGEFTENT